MVATTVLGKREQERGLARPRRFALAPYLYLAPAVAVMGLVYAYPIVQVVRASLLERGRGAFVGLLNYVHLLGDDLFWQSIRNNLTLFLVIPILVGLSVILATILYERPFGWQTHRTLIFFPYMLSVVVVGIAFDYIYQGRGLLNTGLTAIGLGFLTQEWLGNSRTALAAVAAVIVWRELGFGVTLFLARLSTVSPELFEAARIDGAGWWAVLRHVVVPQLRVVIAVYVGATLIGMLSWVFNYIYVLTRGGPGYSTYVSEYYIYQNAFNYDSLGTASAFSSVLLALVVGGVAFSFMARRGLDQ